MSEESEKIVPIKRSFIGQPEVVSPEPTKPPEPNPLDRAVPETQAEELTRVKAELQKALEINERCIQVNEEHLRLLTEKDHQIRENNLAALEIKKYIDGEALKLKNVAIAYHNINHQWNSINAVRSRLKDLEKNVQSPIYGAPHVVNGNKPDLVNGQGENLDGSKRDNIVSRLDASTRIASAIAHGRVVDKNGNKR